MTAAIFLVLATACMDYRIHDPGGKGDDTGAPPTPPAVDEAKPVDTSWEPGDTGPACTLEPVAAAPAEVRPDCTLGRDVASDPWNLTIEWTWEGMADRPTTSNVMVAPIVAFLSDDDMDGDRDADDDPDVLLVAFDISKLPNPDTENGVLVVLDGTTGEEHFTVDGVNGLNGLSVADIDADGEPEILAWDADCHPMALAADGTLLWRSTARDCLSGVQIVGTDLEGDGVPEVIADMHVLEGATGELRFTMYHSPDVCYTEALPADLDLDGSREILFGEGVLRSDGTLAWTQRVPDANGHWPVAVQVDEDPEAEILVVSGPYIRLYQHDGTLSYEKRTAGGVISSPPAVGDLDGDGDAEAVWAADGLLMMVELDGTLGWTRPVTDVSGLAGCSAFDLDGDGALEVLYADEQVFHILKGGTGEVLYQDEDHNSGTYLEMPVIADIDRDGSAEVLVVENNYHDTTQRAGLVVYRHANDGWPGATTGWPTHDWPVSDVEFDGSVPPTGAPWLDYNGLRAQPAAPAPGAPDLAATLVDACVEDCTDGPYRLSIQLANQGQVAVPEGAPWFLYRVDGDSRTLLASGMLGSLSPGWAADGIVVDLGPEALDATTLELQVDEIGLVPECDEDNNRLVIPGPGCG